MPGLLDALEYVGGSLDKPGRAVRGLLAGKPREGLAAIPFSDTLGITDPEQRTSGRDLTNKYGITRRGDQGWGSWALGLGTEMATDPLSYIPAHSVFKGLGLASKAKMAEPIGEASKSLGLKFDRLHEPPAGMLRHVPEWVNEKTFYHGSGTPGLTGEMLDPLKTDPNNLFGRGIYKTANHDIARSYLTKGVDSRAADLLGRLEDSSLIDDAYERIRRGEFDEFLKKYRPHTLEPGWASGDRVRNDQLSMILSMAKSGARGPGSISGHSDDSHAALRLLIPDAIPPKPTLYQAQSNFGRILDLDQPMNRTAIRQLTDPIVSAFSRPVNPDVIDDLVAEAGRTGLNPGRVIKKFMGMSSGIDTVDPVIRGLRDAGYDAMTHTGGLRAGRGQTLHQVLIGLDPNDVLGLGRKTPYQKWEPYLGESAKSMNPGGIAPRSVPATGAVEGGAGLSTRLRGLREGIPVVKANDSPTRELPERVIGGINDSDRLNARMAFIDFIDTHQGRMGPVPSGWTDYFGNYAGVIDPEAGREEILHSLTQAAAKNTTGEIDFPTIKQLPWLARPAALGYRAADATGSRNLTGLAQVLDELSAKTMAGRGATGKLGAAMDFLFSPETHAAYHPQFRQFGRLAPAVYHGVPLGMAEVPAVGARAYGSTVPGLDQ